MIHAEENKSTSDRKAKNAARAKAWRDSNPERAKAVAKRCYEKHRAERLAWHATPEQRKKAAAYARERYEKDGAYKTYLKTWRIDNLEHLRTWSRAYYALNAERKRASARDLQKRRRPKLAAYEAKRRSLKVRSTPSWADSSKILFYYEEAKRLTDETGILHHVDHIVPLRSKWVCGLHCEDNLQVLMATENISKSNRTWPGMSPL